MMETTYIPRYCILCRMERNLGSMYCDEVCARVSSLLVRDVNERLCFTPKGFEFWEQNRDKMDKYPVCVSVDN